MRVFKFACARLVLTCVVFGSMTHAGDSNCQKGVFCALCGWDACNRVAKESARIRLHARRHLPASACTGGGKNLRDEAVAVSHSLSPHLALALLLCVHLFACLFCSVYVLRGIFTIIYIM